MLKAHYWKRVTQSLFSGLRIRANRNIALQNSNLSSSQNLNKLPGCNDYLLYDFIKVTTGQKPPPANWDDILAEYSELSGDVTLSKVFNLTKQITYLTNRLNIIQLILNQLSLKRNEELVAELVKMGFRLPFTDLENDLQRVVTLARSDNIKLKKFISEYEDLKSQPTKAGTEFDWDENLRELSKYQGYPINKRETTVSEFLAIEKGYKEHIEYLKKQNGKH